MSIEASRYDPMSIHSLVDDIYSSSEVQEEIRAQRSMTQQIFSRRFRRVINIETLMNERVTELFGEYHRGTDHDAIDNLQRGQLNDDAAAQNEITVVDNS